MSLNLHGMVRGVISSINADTPATLRRSTGYTTEANGKQVPAYTDTPGTVQVQALSSSQLQHMDALNIQGIMRKVYMYGEWGGPVRADKTGGDLLVFDSKTWKIVTVLEQWDRPGWSCVGVVQQ